MCVCLYACACVRVCVCGGIMVIVSGITAHSQSSVVRQMELSVGSFLTTIDAAMFVIDCLPNMTPAMVTNNTQPLVAQLRQRHPTTPIVLASGLSPLVKVSMAGGL